MYYRLSKKIAVFILVNLFFSNLLFGQELTYKEGWKALPSILKKIVPPKFPSKIFDITKFGAIGDGKIDCTEAFKLAIEKCNASGGGKVVVPRGTYLTGAIHLKSNVNLNLSKNAIIKFSTDPQKYLPVVFTRWEGVECMNYSALIYAYGQENIAITGEGLLDGQAADSNWWNWKGKDPKNKNSKFNQKPDRDKLMEMGEKNIPVEERIFGDGHYLRPNFVQFYKCKNILLKGISVKNSPMWVLHPVLCSNVSILNVKIEGFGPNTDGCDPESCENVLIKDCYFNNGDDCIAIKSGRNNDGRRVNVPSKNIVIQGCTMKEGHGGVVMGSEISGGVMNVYAENCAMDSPNLDRALRFKTNSIRGGTIENVFMRNVKIGQVGGEILRIDFYYEEGDKGTFIPVIRNIFMNNVSCNKSEYAVNLRGYERSPIDNVRIENCTFNNVKKESVIENVKNLVFSNVKVNGKKLIYK